MNTIYSILLRSASICFLAHMSTLTFALPIEMHIQVEKGNVASWEPIRLKLTIRNQGDDVISYAWNQKNLGQALRFRVISNNTGRTPPADIQLPPEGWLETERFLQPQTEIEMHVLLNQWLTFSEPGTYKVRASIQDSDLDDSETLGEDTFDVIIVPGEESELRSNFDAFLSKYETPMSIRKLEVDYQKEAERQRHDQYIGFAYSGSPLVASYLTCVATNGSFEPEYQRSAVEGLGRIRGTTGVDALVKILQMDTDMKRYFCTHLVIQILDRILMQSNAEARKQIDGVKTIIDKYNHKRSLAVHAKPIREKKSTALPKTNQWNTKTGAN